LISQETRERAEGRAKEFYHRENKLKNVWGEEVFTGRLLVLALEYQLGRRLEATLIQSGEAAWEAYLETEGISRVEAEEYMHMAAAVDGCQGRTCKDSSH
jgi:hypothetical protein